MSILFALLLIPFGAIHFLPTIIAALRGSRSVVGIFLVNLFLGWTVIGWVVALIWALSSDRRVVYVYQPPMRPYRY